MKQNYQFIFSSRYRNGRSWTTIRRRPEWRRWGCHWCRKYS